MKKHWAINYLLSTSEDPDQTGRMPRLIQDFTGRTSFCCLCRVAAQIVFRWVSYILNAYIIIIWMVLNFWHYEYYPGKKKTTTFN